MITTIVLCYSRKCFTDKDMLVVLSEVMETIYQMFVKANLKPCKSDFRWNGPMHSLKWCNKREFIVIFTTHEATDIFHSYTNLLSRVNLSDQYLISYSFKKRVWNGRESSLSTFSTWFCWILLYSRSNMVTGSCHIMILGTLLPKI